MKLYEEVYEIVKKIPKGRISTYKEVARALGNEKLARAVGQILRRNKDPMRIPCYRVVKSNGEVGGYSLGVEMKIKLLKEDGIEIEDGRIKEFDKLFYKFEGLGKDSGRSCEES